MLVVIHLVVPTIKGFFVLTLSCKEQEDEMAKLLDDLRGFFEEAHGLLLSQAMEHEIQLIFNMLLPNLGMYKNSMIENEEFKQQVNELLENGVIKPSSSPCGSSMVLVPKDGGWRMFIDHHTFNNYHQELLPTPLH